MNLNDIIRFSGSLGFENADDFLGEVRDVMLEAGELLEDWEPSVSAKLRTLAGQHDTEQKGGGDG